MQQAAILNSAYGMALQRCLHLQELAPQVPVFLYTTKTECYKILTWIKYQEMF